MMVNFKLGNKCDKDEIAEPSSMQGTLRMGSVQGPLSPGVLIAQWIECRHIVWEVMALILIGDSVFFLCPTLVPC